MKKELWLRLKHYHFDHLVPAHLADHVTAAFGGADASTKAFANKLARKLGWSTPFALHAIDEYKKFVYLGIVSDFAVTPAKVIDQVWHEHLLFSRAYRDFCRDVLRRDFDHNPELVPTSDQTDVFQTQYIATLDLYETEFHTAPPVDVWGMPKFMRTRPAPDQKPKPRPADSASASYSGDPLWMYFDGSGGGSHGHAQSSMAEFGGGGGFSGAGSEGSWGGDSSHGHGDSGSGHGDSGGGDSGGGDGGGSGCSSGCGGGGCGS